LEMAAAGGTGHRGAAAFKGEVPRIAGCSWGRGSPMVAPVISGAGVARSRKGRRKRPLTCGPAQSAAEAGTRATR
jgi:hypothetical protein